jgi:ATP-dependent RNA helicase DDX49/DBP8
MADSFADLGVSHWLVETLKSLSIRRPTPVQAACIPALLEGRNTVAIAPTVQGKTATFAIPMLQALSRDPYGVFGVIITPTRELAFQMDEQIKVFCQKVSVRTSVIVGGMDK